MDAASNNSVDDIRDLRESVAYAPVSGRHKVYILDEAHMLSSQAWNAFLKTLEEPPPHTIFVLATTEAQKVLPTVVDRCHRFDFGRPTVEDLATVITRVAGQEGIEIAPDAVALLARHATGSFRDALGTLEQLVTYSGREVATEDVLAVLGVADADLLFGALEAVGAHDARGALVAAASLASSGRDLGQVMRDLEAHARELLIVQTLGEVPSELHITPDRDARLAEQAGRVGRADLVRFLELLADAMKAVKDGAEARTRVELALVEAASPQVDPSARALMARLEALEAALARGGGRRSRRVGRACAGGRRVPSRLPRPPRRRRARSGARGPVRARAARRRERKLPRGRCRCRWRRPAGDARDGAAAARGRRRGRRTRPPRRPSPRCRCPRRRTSTAWPPSGPRSATPSAPRTRWSASRSPTPAPSSCARTSSSSPSPARTASTSARRRCPSTARSSRTRSAAWRAARCASASSCATSSPRTPRRSARPPSEDEIVARFVTEFDAQEIVPDPDDEKEGEA